MSSKKDIEKIIRDGSTKDKIKLYMTDIALFNLSYSREDAILTDKERDYIYNSITDPKDIKYYSELRNSNKAFVVFKEYLASYYKRILLLNIQCEHCKNFHELHSIYEGVINDILELSPDKKTKDLILKTVVNKTKTYNDKGYQKKGKEDLLDVSEMFRLLALNIKHVSEEIVTIKKFYGSMKRFLSKHLPIKPYIDYVNDYEKKIIKVIDHIITIQEFYKDNLPKDLKQLTPYKDIIIEVTLEDVQNIKNASI